MINLTFKGKLYTTNSVSIRLAHFLAALPFAPFFFALLADAFTGVCFFSAALLGGAAALPPLAVPLAYAEPAAPLAALPLTAPPFLAGGVGAAFLASFLITFDALPFLAGTAGVAAAAGFLAAAFFFSCTAGLLALAFFVGAFICSSIFNYIL